MIWIDRIVMAYSLVVSLVALGRLVGLGHYSWDTVGILFLVMPLIGIGYSIHFRIVNGEWE